MGFVGEGEAMTAKTLTEHLRNLLAAGCTVNQKRLENTIP